MPAAVHPSELAEAYEVCRTIARRQAKNFFYGFLALPAQKRDAMCAVYAFMRRADDISDDESLTLEDRRLLMDRWNRSWQTGESVAPEDRAVFLALSDVQRRYGVSGDLLKQLVQGTTMDLEPVAPEGVTRIAIGQRNVDAYETFGALERYCYLVASVVGLVTIRIFGYRDPAAEDYAVRLGLAFQLTNILRDVREDAERGRVYLPMEMLALHGLTPADVLNAAEAGTMSQALRACLADLAERAEQAYAAQAQLVPRLSADSRAAMRVLVTIYHLLLQEIVRADFDVFSKRRRVSTPRKLRVLLGGVMQSRFGRGRA